MTILPITLYGDEILEKKTKQITKVDDKIIRLVKDMIDTMHNANGMGLAANQVGSNKALFVTDLGGVKGYEDESPRVFLNPKIVEQSEETSVIEEGCLSIPSLRGEVERPKGIKLIYQDLELKEHELYDEDLLARVIQHEYDHLNGKYFVERIEKDEFKKLKKSLKKIQDRKMDVDYPVTQKPK
ncbi:MAG: peptide deformylase [Ignavibacteriaceae bacterium]|nr:peptide deformylase [Ignavibacteriaceae bacterium]